MKLSKVKITFCMVLIFMLIMPSYLTYGFNDKFVYLTFDDGPNSVVTPKILTILSRNNINGTFFVVGENVEKNSAIMQLINKQGSAIMPHTYCHKFENIYNTSQDYFKDLEKCEGVIKGVGIKNSLRCIRMPGGMNNEYCSGEILKEIRSELSKRDKLIIDWTVDSGDTMKANVGLDDIKNNLENYSGCYEVEVVLMHDLGDKEVTVESLEWIIEFYRNKGYKFKTLDQISNEEIRYLKSIKVISN